jgi:hypothetical protein
MINDVVHGIKQLRPKVSKLSCCSLTDRKLTIETALPGYEERIQSHGVLLEKRIAESAGTPINITKWFYFLAFDVMGDFAFDKSFDMLESKEWHYAVVLLRRALGLLGPFSSVPWLAQLAFNFPIIPIIRDWNRMLGWCADRMAEQVDVSKSLVSNSSSGRRADLRRMGI